jgi:hypothetical protein
MANRLVGVQHVDGNAIYVNVHILYTSPSVPLISNSAGIKENALMPGEI